MSKTPNRLLAPYAKDGSFLGLTDFNKRTKAERSPILSPILMMSRRMRFISLRLLLLVCASASPANAYQLAGYKWPQPTTTFYVDIPGAGGLWNRSFETAMSYWGVYTLFKYEIVRGEYEDTCDPPEGRNGVRFMASICGDAWGNTALAATHSTFAGATLIQTDIVFNSNQSWDVYSTSWQSDGWAGINDFQRVAVHELGHALGLRHEDSGVATIMTTRALQVTIPQQDDINGVAALYGDSHTTASPSGSGGGGCFISTAAFGSLLEGHVQLDEPSQGYLKKWARLIQMVHGRAIDYGK